MTYLASLPPGHGLGRAAAQMMWRMPRKPWKYGSNICTRRSLQHIRRMGLTVSLPFSQTLRSLGAERRQRIATLGLAGAGLILGALWLIWFTFAPVTVYVTSVEATLQVDQKPYPVQTSIAGRVTAAPLQVGKIVAFVTQYIEHAPALMIVIDEAATRNGAQTDVLPILEATENYFLVSDDIIPDHYGLVGLLDDAYLAHSLMEAISDRYMRQSGKSLVPIEAHALNTFISG